VLCRYSWPGLSLLHLPELLHTLHCPLLSILSIPHLLNSIALDDRGVFLASLSVFSLVGQISFFFGSSLFFLPPLLTRTYFLIIPWYRLRIFSISLVVLPIAKSLMIPCFYKTYEVIFVSHSEEESRLAIYIVHTRNQRNMGQSVKVPLRILIMGLNDLKITNN